MVPVPPRSRTNLLTIALVATVVAAAVPVHAQATSSPVPIDGARTAASNTILGPVRPISAPLTGAVDDLVGGPVITPAVGAVDATLSNVVAATGTSVGAIVAPVPIVGQPVAGVVTGTTGAVASGAVVAPIAAPVVPIVTRPAAPTAVAPAPAAPSSAVASTASDPVAASTTAPLPDAQVTAPAFSVGDLGRFDAATPVATMPASTTDAAAVDLRPTGLRRRDEPGLPGALTSPTSVVAVAAPTGGIRPDDDDSVRALLQERFAQPSGGSSPAPLLPYGSQPRPWFAIAAIDTRADRPRGPPCEHIPVPPD